MLAILQTMLLGGAQMTHQAADFRTWMASCPGVSGGAQLCVRASTAWCQVESRTVQLVHAFNFTQKAINHGRHPFS
jgi:hypothetical protein